jgi:hypothetical protein
MPPAAAMGYFASRVGPQHHPLPDLPRDPLDGIYGPTFGKALSLAKRLRMTPTTEVVKSLEIAEMVQSTSDPCPQKKRKFHGQGFIIKDKGKGKEKATDDDEVSLGYSSDEGLFGLEEDPMNNEDVQKGHIDDGMDFTVDREIAEMMGLDYRQVAFNLEITIANFNQQLDKDIAVVNNNKYNCSPCSHECDHKETKEWLIDSGASAHFTNNINDFVEYEELTSQTFVRTANSSAQIMGKGTVILSLSTSEVVKISPVFYKPSLNCQLLFMGAFLRAGFTSTGNNTSIRIMNG